MQYALVEAQTDAEFTSKATTLLAAQLRYLSKEKPRCTLGLCGGTTPHAIYEALGKERGIDWKKVHLFLIDERYVAPDDKDSNQKLVMDTFVKHAQIPRENIVFPDTTLPLPFCLSDYDQRLGTLLGMDSADIVTIGMGDDGHIASLFPPLDEEAFSATTRVIHTQADRFAVHDRISVTLPLLVAAKLPIFLLKGDAKKQIWKEMIATQRDSRRWPAHSVLAEGRATVVMGA